MCEEWGRNYDAVFEGVPPLLTTVIAALKYFHIIVTLNKIQRLLSHIKNDVEYLMTLPQQPILVKYAEQGRKIAMYYGSYIMLVASLYSMLPILPGMLHISKSQNGTSRAVFVFPVEYFVDEQKYYYEIILHCTVSVLTVSLVIVASDVLFFQFIQHGCALFAVTGNWLKNLHILDEGQPEDEKLDWNSIGEKQRELLHQKLRFGILLHKRCIRYAALLESAYVALFGVEILILVLLLSCTGLEFIINLGSLDGLLRFGTYAFAVELHLFCLCFPGQLLINHGLKVYHEACEGMWYLFPHKTMALYQLLLARSTTPCRITGGKITTLSMETFVSITQTAVSYFTVMSSLR